MGGLRSGGSGRRWRSSDGSHGPGRRVQRPPKERRGRVVMRTRAARGRRCASWRGCSAASGNGWKIYPVERASEGCCRKFVEQYACACTRTRGQVCQVVARRGPAGGLRSQAPTRRKSLHGIERARQAAVQVARRVLDWPSNAGGQGDGSIEPQTGDGIATKRARVAPARMTMAAALDCSGLRATLASI